MRGDHHALTDLSETPHALRGAGRETDAAMRGGVARHDAQVHGHTRPGDPLHERHRRAAVDVGAVIPLTADDAEDARRRTVARHPSRDLGARHQTAAVVDGNVLVGDREDGKERARRLVLRNGSFLVRLPTLSIVALSPTLRDGVSRRTHHASLGRSGIAEPPSHLLRMGGWRRR